MLCDFVIKTNNILIDSLFSYKSIVSTLEFLQAYLKFFDMSQLHFHSA